MNADDGRPASTLDDLLAAARFGVPELTSSHVHRPRLLEALARADTLQLVVVGGPAGTGKTSLVAEWIRRAGGDTTGWITFEDGDTDFWDYLIECLDRLGLDVPDPGRGAKADSLGRQGLIALAAAIAESPQRWTVVVDGYEMVSLDLAREVDYLLRHTFGHLRLVFVSRVDPVLPLYRYRLRDALLEIRAADLAFTDEEAATLLRRAGVRLGRAAVHDLNERVRGWAAGLRFAARALADQEDPGKSVATVVAQTGDINEYLIGEVLDAQPPDIRRILLDTCVTDLLYAGLIEELAGTKAAHVLAELARSNAFIEPVPDRAGSYRYYPFFRDLLRAQLAYDAPQRMMELHRKAAGWFERHGHPRDSLDQLAAIAAWEEVAALIVDELMIGRLLLEGPDGALSRVARQVPEEPAQPAGHVVRAVAALAGGDEVACAQYLARARRMVEDQDVRQKDAVVLSLSVVDAVRACRSEDAASAAALAEQAERAVNGWPSRTASGCELPGLVQFIRGITSLRCGDLRLARKALLAAASSDAARSRPAFRADCLGNLAVIDALNGQLSRASQKAAEALTIAKAAGLPAADRPPAAHVALARVALDHYELKACREQVAFAMSCLSLPGDPISRVLTEGVQAGLEAAGGYLEAALTRLGAESARATRTDPWLADRLRVEAAELSMAGGRVDLALRLLAAVEHADQPDVAVVAAAAYVEQGQESAVEESLVRARAGEPSLRAQVARLLVEGVQEAGRRSPNRAHTVLDRSLRLAAKEQLRRPFHEAGPSVRRLLSADIRLTGEHWWLSHPGAEHRESTASAEAEPEVVEALTAKELEVLGHLEEMLTTEEIAEKMFVSVNTLRTHVRSILRKLGVNRRNAAVRKARRLGLLDG
ncbi:MAG TPA: LuxR C-terminal-related transcriptional regulator [Kribbella sp.]|nr:LuxR C-terminal-related transcriptional regulator [Kribbella sp.]